jgi:hypothetical protein
MMGAAFSFFVARMGSIRLIPEVRADLRTELVRFCSKDWPRYFVLAVLGFIVRLPALPGELVWGGRELTSGRRANRREVILVITTNAKLGINTAL